MYPKKHQVIAVLFSLILAFSVSTVNIQSAHATDEDPKILNHQQFSTPIYIQDNWSNSQLKDKQDILWSFLNKYKPRFHIKNNVKSNFQLKQETTDKQGQSHFRLQQTYHGVPVYGADQTIHLNKQNHVTSYFGQFIPLSSKKIDTTAKLSKQQALQTAQKTLNLKQLPDNPKVKLMIYPDKNQYTLAYIVKLSLINPPAYWHLVIDAHSGKVLKKHNLIQHVEGSGKGVLGDTKQLEVRCKNNQNPCYLDDQKRNILTYDAENADYSSNKLPGKLISSESKTFDDPAGVDAHAYAAKVYDYYLKTFNRTSYDGKGAKIISSVHVGNQWNNAAWNGEQMLYGDGDGKTFISLAGSLDVIGHELTHAVTEKTAGLQYFNESGAINESISDIFGAAMDSEDWLIGEDIYTPNTKGDALRSMSNPKKYNQPDHYKDRYIGIEDNGGVHINSGINNKAAYLIAAGGTHHNISVTGIGKDKMVQIYYQALTKYLTSTSNFSQMRKAAIHAASDLFGANSSEVTNVKKAYDAVGVK